MLQIGESLCTEVVHHVVYAGVRICNELCFILDENVKDVTESLEVNEFFSLSKQS